eukprot:TRINITY_DN2830_c0_g1_i1.p1 TRINITY_DN2830_c0_g1~~TRINITY_DN2830_c0_g1_i1.p1  ORF type:complete len:129 (+),score=29.91 TRINITY_DN2830_c0_g1_i1:47-388(+)
MGLESSQPQGAFYLMIDWETKRKELEKVGVKTNRQLAHFLLNEAKVATLCGSDFGFKEEALTLRLASTDYDGQNAFNKFNLSDHSENLSLFPRVVEGCNRLEKVIRQLNDISN